MNKEDLTNNIRCKGISGATTDTLEESSSKKTVVGVGFTSPHRCGAKDGKADKDDRTTSKG